MTSINAIAPLTVSLLHFSLYDCDAKTATATQILPGGTIDMATAPKNFALSPVYSASIRQVALNINGKYADIQAAPPFTVPNKNGGGPWPVVPGAYTVFSQVTNAAGVVEPVQMFQVTVINSLLIPIPTTAPKPASNATTTLATGRTFTAGLPMDLSGLTSAIVSTDANSPAVLQGAAGGASVISSNESTNGCVLSNVILDSVDGGGIGWNVKGSNLVLSNPQHKNLSDSICVVNATNLTMIGGKQIGKVTGRCVFITNWNGGAWTGGTAGPSVNQSPVRCSSDITAANGGGLQNVIVTGLSVTQVGSAFPIACVAGHRILNCKFIDCTVNNGEFSFASAGAGEQDEVSNVLVQNLTTINTKLDIQSIASNVQISGGTFNNPSGECVSLSCGPGITIDGATMYSPKHGVHFYQPSNAIIRNCRLIAPGFSPPMLDGSCTAANDGGGNTVNGQPWKFG
jgi:hypothetical protein